MHKTTKGALATGAAAVLLTGGAGTLAFWTDSLDVGTSNITSGTVTLTAPTCVGAGLHNWELDGAGAYTPGVTNIVPGDVITKVCSATLTLNGEHVGATLAIDTAALVADPTTTLDTELAATATFLVDGAAYAPLTAPGTYAIKSTITVTFDGPAATNGSKLGDVDLGAVNITATQTHS
ncbi:hypothetical protein NPS01_21390 [Nocardioides psychrotolerans]|uniref:Alternate signal-mediated exported protein, RER_14450 family n=1 Tax=Nocardioides psychrotolerans TaxID=1005945 RepID=A0A1I3KHU5_9ACTN|nr:alternate-type signal peptide domain-containing protein [Nocardioides psychrotolerans]GEP38476.1 hypothetical protein NPS01_21390 [Nocardioides psychrotolerans]SFI71920.1 alternate signal-mediated exported protein, RER_14450 family [Nocardioides psychrotolerans]